MRRQDAETRRRIEQVGRDRVAETLAAALQSFARPSGSVRLDNVFRVVIARA